MRLSPAQVIEERNRVERQNYRKFLKRIHLVNVRGFIDESVEFRYPVTALIGTNGGGKSTILGAAALAYQDVKPGTFFPKAFVGDDAMADWRIEYELIDRPISADALVRRSARFAAQRWRRREFPDRHVEYIEIQRTVPAGELPRFKKFIGANDPGVRFEQLSEQTVQFAGAILSKDISGYRIARLPDDRSKSMYVGVTQGQGGYSQFHFGAGEASVIALVDRIEGAPENSLILFEEIENGLHPVAVRLVVQYLQHVARRRRHQIILTTHSQDAVDELPGEGIWASINKRTFNGSLSIESLRAITGQIPDERVIFVEDRFVREWLENALRRFDRDLARTAKIFEAGGYPNVEKVGRFHNENPATELPAISIVDGDLFDPAAGQQLDEHSIFLGEGIPEAIVFDYIFDHREELAGLIRQRCLLSGFQEDDVISEIEIVRNSACDPHVIFARLAEALDFSSEISIRSGMIDIFNERNRDFWQGPIEFIQSMR